jgi:hypothetical protein
MLPSKTSFALMETAEVLPSGVPNFMLELQYDTDAADPGRSAGDLAHRMRGTYHFGIGFGFDDFRSDVDIYRRTGPTRQTESGITFKTMLYSETAASSIPSFAILYGYAMKTSSYHTEAFIHTIRHGLVVSRTWKLNTTLLTPYAAMKGDYHFSRPATVDAWVGTLHAGTSARFAFTRMLRFYIEGVVGFGPEQSGVLGGLEFVMLPSVESLVY